MGTTDTVGRPMVVHLVDEDIYLQLTFKSWTDGAGLGGGGFSYVRSTPAGTPAHRTTTVWTGEEITFTKNDFGDYTPRTNKTESATRFGSLARIRLGSTMPLLRRRSIKRPM